MTANAPAAPVVSLTGFSAEYRTRLGVTRALDGIDLDVARGELLAIVGESADQRFDHHALAVDRRRSGGENQKLHAVGLGGGTERCSDRSWVRLSQAAKLTGGARCSPRWFAGSRDS